jgi:zinc transport system permease protein
LGEFFEAVRQQSFMQNALLAGVVASIACGMIGSYVVARRITYIAGGIAHCVLGGMGAARYLSVGYGWEWLHPLHGAIVAAMLAAAIIGIVSLQAKEREDTIIGALWAIGMAVGILFVFKTPGYSEDLMSYLFGNILLVSREDLWLIAGLDVIVIVVALLFYNPLLAVCFDEEFARLRGVPVAFFYLLLLELTAVTVVLLVSVVGIVLVIALLTLPAAIAGHFTRTLGQTMVLAVLLSLGFTTGGLALSYGPNLPTGATTIMLAGGFYLVVAAGSRIIRRITAAQRRRSARTNA